MHFGIPFLVFCLELRFGVFERDCTFTKTSTASYSETHTPKPPFVTVKTLDQNDAPNPPTTIKHIEVHILPFAKLARDFGAAQEEEESVYSFAFHFDFSKSATVCICLTHRKSEIWEI
jgi:hypothetical protein